MGTRLCFAEERRPTRGAEFPVHLVATIRDTGIVVGLASGRELSCTETGVDRSAAGADILAIPAPAHARDHRGRRAFPANRPTETSTCYRHMVIQETRGKALIANPTSESTGTAIARASTSLSVFTGDVTPNPAFDRTRRLRVSTWRASVRRAAQLGR